MQEAHTTLGMGVRKSSQNTITYYALTAPQCPPIDCSSSKETPNNNNKYGFQNPENTAGTQVQHNGNKVIQLEVVFKALDYYTNSSRNNTNMANPLYH